MEKDSYGSLGFSVAGAASLGGCYIKKVIKDPALSEGTLRAGDKLLEVRCKICKLIELIVLMIGRCFCVRFGHNAYVPHLTYKFSILLYFVG